MRRFWSDKKGNVAVIFALAIVPLIGAVGAAVDYSMAATYRTDMQKAVDAAALALSKILPADDTKLNQVGLDYFNASMGPNTLENVVLVATPAQGKVTVVVTADYKPYIASLPSIFGVEKIPIGAQSEAHWGIGKVEIALVLDNSLSMNDLGRIDHLKAAANDLLNVLETAAKAPGDAKVAIVPFDGMVKVSSASPVPSWIKWNYWDSNYTVQTCTGWGWKKTCSESPESHSNWAGCVYDRDKDPSVNHDVLDTAPTNSATYYPAAKCFNNALQAITPLTENWTVLHTKVNALTPTGYTNINIGLVWGWHVLSPSPLHAEGASYTADNLAKYIILMTDGNNTKSRYYDCPISGPCPTIDGRTSLTCTNVKNIGIKIYTIRLISGNATLLSGCATNPSMYYDVQDAAQLSGVFSSIGAEIANLHLAK